ncbi:hypothetical protein [uncultured Flavobacterium sp.]|uniref:hypothetical protein n=1 Tax=uncultured Flavobacterium sp. TaxID=165435 RepID=UPI0025D39A7B|nr:hypothetical protein [uncultured Flavobacterium sp.]
MKRYIFLIALLPLLFSCKKEDKPVTIEASPEKEIPKSTAAVFHWQDELCDHNGTYDYNKYTVSQLEGTHFLARCAGSLDLDVSTNISSPKGFDTFDKEALAGELDEKYKEWKEKYNSLDIVPQPFWQNLRMQLLKALDMRYELKKIMLESYDNPQILLDNRFANGCREYGEALASGDHDAILAAWRDFYDELIASGKMHPDSRHVFEEKYNSDDRLRHAIADLSTYAWYNCANHQIKDPDTNISYFGEFEKLFIKVESECDEP